MERTRPLIELIFKAILVTMAVASVVLTILNVAPVQVNVLLLGIGLFALPVAVLPKGKPQE